VERGDGGVRREASKHVIPNTFLLSRICHISIYQDEIKTGINSISQIINGRGFIIYCVAVLRMESSVNLFGEVRWRVKRGQGDLQIRYAVQP
jgi:hypothetical protein